MQLDREVSVLGPASSSFNLFGKDLKSKVLTVVSDPTIECQNGQISNAGTDADGGRSGQPNHLSQSFTPGAPPVKNLVVIGISAL
ncbi:MAG: hypothetical protein ACC655_00630 [Rhodothermia bacterium]